MTSSTEALKLASRWKRLRVKVCQLHHNVDAVTTNGPFKAEADAIGIGCIPQLCTHAIPDDFHRGGPVRKPPAIRAGEGQEPAPGGGGRRQGYQSNGE